MCPSRRASSTSSSTSRYPALGFFFFFFLPATCRDERELIFILKRDTETPAHLNADFGRCSGYTRGIQSTSPWRSFNASWCTPKSTNRCLLLSHFFPLSFRLRSQKSEIITWDKVGTSPSFIDIFSLWLMRYNNADIIKWSITFFLVNNTSI